MEELALKENPVTEVRTCPILSRHEPIGSVRVMLSAENRVIGTYYCEFKEPKEYRDARPGCVNSNTCKLKNEEGRKRTLCHYHKMGAC